MVKLPKPEFYVFYNGKDKIETESVLRLSDAYIEDDISGQNTEEKNTNNTQNALDRKEESSLELIVKVIDINADSKAELEKLK